MSRSLATLATLCALRTLLTPVQAEEPAWTSAWSQALQVQELAVDAAGKRLFAADRDRVLVLDPASGALLETLPGDGMRGLAVSASGRVAACGFGKVSLWDDLGQTPLEPLALEGLSKIGLSPRGDRLAVMVRDGDRELLQVWDLEKRQPRKLTSLAAHRAMVNELSFDAAGERFVSAAQDGVLKVWRAKDGELLHTLEAPGVCFSGAAFTADGARLITSDFNREIRVWDLASGKTERTTSGLQKMQCLSLGGGGKLLATGHWGGALRLWDAEQGTLEREMTYPNELAGAVVVSPDGRWVAALHGKIPEMRLEVYWKGAPPPTEKPAAESWTGTIPRGFAGLAFSPDGKTLFGTGIAGQAWPLGQPSGGFALSGALESAGAVLVHEGTLWVVRDRAIRRLDPRTGAAQEGGVELPGPHKEMSMSIHSAAFDGAGTLAVVHRESGKQHPVELIDLVKGKVERLVDEPSLLSTLAISPDGARIALGTPKEVRVWARKKPGRPITLTGASGEGGLAFSADGKLLFAAGEKDRRFVVVAWSLEKNGREVRSIELPGSPSGAAFDVQRKRAAVATDHGVHLLDLEGGKLLRTFELPGELDHRIGLAFDPAGKRLAVSSTRGEVTKVLDLAQPAK